MTYDAAIEKLAKRVGMSVTDARAYADRQIESAVREMHAGQRHSISLLDRELQPFARARFDRESREQAPAGGVTRWHSRWGTA